jgi:hypothetical protein
LEKLLEKCAGNGNIGKQKSKREISKNKDVV